MEQDQDQQGTLVNALLRLLSCFIAVIAAPLAFSADQATYSKDVAPILNENCVSCHRPGEIAPMSLMTYKEVRPWARSVAREVYERRMPPWHADPEFGEFKNARGLTQDEIDTIVRWSHEGAVQGSRADLPDSPTFPEVDWKLGEPDYVVKLPSMTIPADGPDRFYDLEAPTNLPEDSWVTAVEIKPGNRSVVHHVILWQGKKNQQDGWIGAWGAGAEPMRFRKGTGRLVKRGVPMIGDMHYHPAGVEAIDSTEIGLHVADSPSDIKAPLSNLWVINVAFAIPPGAANHEVRASHTFEKDTQLISLMPHMHYRGKDFTYTLAYPDGRRETLLRVGNYDFNWQTEYQLKDPIRVPAGTTVECVAHFDNSSENYDNPDPYKTVYFGNESYDEMMIGFIDHVEVDVELPSESGPPGGLAGLAIGIGFIAGLGFAAHKVTGRFMG